MGWRGERGADGVLERGRESRRRADREDEADADRMVANMLAVERRVEW